MRMHSLVLACVMVSGAAAAQSMEGMHHDHGEMQQQQSAPAARSALAYPMQEVQEPEALEFRTGENLPAPELLKDVMQKPAMTLAQWLDLAETHHPSLIEARAAVTRSEQQARQVALPPDPVVGYSGEHIRGGSYHGGEQGAFLSQEIVLGRKLALRRDVARAEGKANELGVETQRARVHNDVAQRFFDALSAQVSVSIHERMLKRAEDAQVNAHELMRVGQADAADVLKAEIQAEQAKMDFVDAQRMFLGAFGRLAATAGVSSMSAQPLDGKLTEPPQMDIQDLMRKGVDDSPAVKQATASVAIAEAQVKSAKRESIPDMKITAGEWYSGERLDGTNKAAGWMGFAQAGVQLPLWNRNQGNVGAAKAELSRAQAAVVRTQMWTRDRAEPIAQQYEQARFTAERYRTQMLPRARRAYELEVMKYQQMGQAYPKVLEAQAMLYELELGYVKALHEEWSTAIALENFTLDGALEKPVSIGAEDAMRNLPSSAGN
ncbi:TolC family protein [Terriglobus roseus]|uniref:Outer membrane protein, cobalt-zinc-cadmium efflux system n=1 Tax=Terriglobus roseus TaxID=392734 RepID=A0A1G7K6U3_9BACT|nr:TolC family protein [Terriglobus roseus]SDF32721.1 outer membrane protein, cobalt-zinc-cadmium efflux system [Terriglobus roseus]